MSKQRTAEDYRTALEITEVFNTAPGMKIRDFKDYCNEEIRRLEKPVYKKYRCIKRFSGMPEGHIVTEGYDRFGVFPWEMPFHFEEIIPEPIAQKITWHDLVRELNEGFSWDGQISKFWELVRKIESDHGVSYIISRL